MGSKEKIFQQAEENLQRLLQGGGNISLALELQAALEEAKCLGGVTYRLINADSAALLWWANGIIGATSEGCAPALFQPHQRYLN